jgi:hypothetical protein
MFCPPALAQEGVDWEIMKCEIFFIVKLGIARLLLQQSGIFTSMEKINTT